eukprot:2164654-Pleurochrysis_carterae.AAC.1
MFSHFRLPSDERASSLVKSLIFTCPRLATAGVGKLPRAEQATRWRKRNPVGAQIVIDIIQTTLFLHASDLAHRFGVGRPVGALELIAGAWQNLLQLWGLIGF